MADTYPATVDEARAAGQGLVLVERAATHAVVTLNDPAKLNPLSPALTVRLRDVLTELDQAIAMEEFAEPLGWPPCVGR